MFAIMYAYGRVEGVLCGGRAYIICYNFDSTSQLLDPALGTASQRNYVYLSRLCRQLMFTCGYTAPRIWHRRTTQIALC